jgi:hypothetical protein
VGVVDEDHGLAATAYDDSTLMAAEVVPVLTSHHAGSAAFVSVTGSVPAGAVAMGVRFALPGVDLRERSEPVLSDLTFELGLARDPGRVPGAAPPQAPESQAVPFNWVTPQTAPYAQWDMPRRCGDRRWFDVAAWYASQTAGLDLELECLHSFASEVAP